MPQSPQQKDRACNAANTLGNVANWAAVLRDTAALGAVVSAPVPGLDAVAVPALSAIAIGAGAVNLGATAASGLIEGFHTGNFLPFGLNMASNGLSSAAGFSGYGAVARAGLVVKPVGYGAVAAGAADQAGSKLIDKSKISSCAGRG